jgi:hypothetical protein
MFNECSMNEQTMKNEWSMNKQTLVQMKVDQNGRSKTIEKSIKCAFVVGE